MLRSQGSINKHTRAVRLVEHFKVLHLHLLYVGKPLWFLCRLFHNYSQLVQMQEVALCIWSDLLLYRKTTLYTSHVNVFCSLLFMLLRCKLCVLTWSYIKKYMVKAYCFLKAKIEGVCFELKIKFLFYARVVYINCTAQNV